MGGGINSHIFVVGCTAFVTSLSMGLGVRGCDAYFFSFRYVALYLNLL